MALRHLAEFFGLWASKWMGQFAAGFPIAGDLSQNKAFPHKTPEDPLLPKKQLRASAEARFCERPQSQAVETRLTYGKKRRANTPRSGWLPQ